MRNTPLFNFLMWFGAFVQFATCAVILFRKLYRQWASILVYCVLAISFDVAIAINRPIYKRYFYLYFGWSFLSALLRLWVLADVVGSFPGTGFIGRKIRWGIAAFAICIALGAVYLTAQDGANHISPIVRSTFIVDRCVAIAWGAFLAVVLLCIRLMGLGWQRTGALIASALIVKIVAGLVFSYLLSFAPPSGRLIGNYLLSVLSIASLLLWLWALSTHREEFYNTGISTVENL